MMKFFKIQGSLIILFALMNEVVLSSAKEGPQTQTNSVIRYVPIGDSYTIGTGATPQESWPSVLTKKLKAQGFSIVLVANPAHAGWTTKEAINLELPVFESAHPNFATLMIGVNDWVQEISAETFRERLTFLMDRMLAVLPDKSRFLVVNIPDFSVVPQGQRFSHKRDIAAGIAQFNAIIKEEAERRQLSVIDIYTLSQEMKNDRSRISGDGLHPSAPEYANWAQKIYAPAFRLLSGQKEK